MKSSTSGVKFYSAFEVYDLLMDEATLQTINYKDDELSGLVRKIIFERTSELNKWVQYVDHNFGIRGHWKFVFVRDIPAGITCSRLILRIKCDQWWGNRMFLDEGESCCYIITA